jgi:hypothetical protein
MRVVKKLHRLKKGGAESDTEAPRAQSQVDLEKQLFGDDAADAGGLVFVVDIWIAF